MNNYNNLRKQKPVNYLQYCKEGSQIQYAGLGDVLKFGASFIPVVGTGIAGYDAIKAAKEGKWGQAALNTGLAAIGLIPGFGSLAGGALRGGLRVVGRAGLAGANVLKAAKPIVINAAEKGAEAAAKIGKQVISKVPKGSALEADINLMKQARTKAKDLGQKGVDFIKGKAGKTVTAEPEIITVAAEDLGRGASKVGGLVHVGPNLPAASRGAYRQLPGQKPIIEIVDGQAAAGNVFRGQKIRDIEDIYPLFGSSYYFRPNTYKQYLQLARSYIPLNNDQLVIGATRAIVPTFYDE